MLKTCIYVKCGYKFAIPFDAYRTHWMLQKIFISSVGRLFSFGFGAARRIVGRYFF